MTWDTALGLLGAAASIAGLAWHRKEAARKAAFIFLGLLGLWLASHGLLYQAQVRRVEGQILMGLGTSLMSADQLYETMNNVDVTRPLFNESLNRAIEGRRLSHRMLELRTADGSVIRVRGYFVP